MVKARVTKSASPSPAIVSIDVTTGTVMWRKKGARYYAFSAQDKHGKRGVIERMLEGMVTNYRESDHHQGWTLSRDNPRIVGKWSELGTESCPLSYDREGDFK